MSAIDLDILAPAFIAGLLILALHVPLGREVLRRGIIFLDLAVAQVAALGTLFAEALAQLLGLPTSPWMIQASAALAALIAVYLLHWIEKRWPQTQEAIIGSVFVLAASAAILVLSHNPHAGERIHQLLSGQILWTDWQQIGWLAALYTPLLLLWWLKPALKRGLGFYLIFALGVTASVQVIGVYLVFASLILPALAVRQRQHRAVAIAYLVGIIGYALGLLGSAIWDLPSGAAIVWALAASALVASALINSLRARRPSG